MIYTRCRSNRYMLLSGMVVLLALLLAGAAPVQAESIIAEPFAAYYWQHHGARVLGAVNSPIVEIDGYRMQYFEKGRLEDHRHMAESPAAAIAYSPLTLELIQQFPDLPIDGMPITYGELAVRGAAQSPAPAGFGGGVQKLEHGVFVPANHALAPGPGYVVPFQMWTYINRRYLFPRGWQHDVGLPLTNAFHLEVAGADGSTRVVIMQAFERTILTLDMANVYGWSVERVNIGTDALWARYITPMVQVPAEPARQAAGPKRIEVDLAQQWLMAYEGDQLFMDVPVSTGKDRFETPPGQFRIYSKTARQTLRGRQNGESWNVPDVPHIMFYYGGFAIHGVYWHDRFGTGERYSHGCVGIAPNDAARLYAWAGYGTPVIVR